MCQSFAASRRHHAFARCLGRGGSEFNRASTFFRISHLSVARGRFWISRKCWAREGGDEYTLNDCATLLSNSVIAPGSARRSSSIASRARPAPELLLWERCAAAPPGSAQLDLHTSLCFRLQ